MNARKHPVNREFKSGNVDLGKVHIYLKGSVYTANHSFVHNRKVQLRGQHAVNTTFARSGIYQGLNSLHSCEGYCMRKYRFKRFVKANIDQ